MAHLEIGPMNYPAGAPALWSPCHFFETCEHNQFVATVSCGKSWDPSSKDVYVQEFIAEFAIRVVGLTQLNELRHLFVDGFQSRGGNRKELSPVRTSFEWRKFVFNDREQFSNRRPILLPGEVNCDARLLVAGAHPKIVRGNGADFRDQQMWAHLFVEPLNRQNGFDGVMARDKVLRLQFLPGAGGKAHAKVWKPLVPRAGNTHLLGTVFRGERCNRMKISGCRFRSEKFGRGSKSLSLLQAAFDPHLVDILVAPIREHADAVGAGFDGLEVVLDLIQGHVQVNILPHHV